MLTIERLQSMMNELTDISRLLEKYLDEVRRLPSKDVCVIITDFDDTIFSKQPQLDWEPLLRECEPHMRNNTIMYHIGVPSLIKKYYQDEIFPQDIVSLLNPSQDLILSAWFEALQQEKLRALNLDHIPLQVVKRWEDKVLAAIQYILFTLKYIPSQLVIYEDKPHYFIEYRQLIEWILGCELTIRYVEMDGNRG